MMQTGGGATASAPAADTQSTREALGALINVAGRQRMLSHRAVMLLALSRMAEASARDDMIGQSAQALSAFETGNRLLTLGDPEHGLPPLFSQRVLGLLDPDGAGGRSALERFVARARACIDRLRRHDREIDGEILALSRLVSDDLLSLLNQIVAAFEADLSDSLRAEAARSANTRLVLERTLEDIEQLGSRINLIAFNALIEAARAGEAGRAFAIIAHEIKALSGQARAESAKMAEAVKSLFA